MRQLMFVGIIILFNLSALAGIEKYSLKHDGRERTYQVYTPKKLRSKAPVVMVFHGGFGDSEKAMEISGMNSLSEQQGFIVVYPNGVSDRRIYGDRGQHWNDGRHMGIDIDDVGFVDKMITHITHRYSIDPARVYATGMSNGGLMTFKLAAELSHRIAAFAPVAALMPENQLRLSEIKAVPLALFMGTADPYMPFDGGSVGSFVGGEVLSAEQTVDLFVDTNKCKRQKSVEIKNVNRWDRSTVTKITFSNCINNKGIEYYRVNNGGHTWPGSQMKGITSGPLNMDISASEDILKFFNKHRLK